MDKEPTAADRLNELLVSAGLPELEPGLAARFQAYLELLMRWNSRVNLTAIQDQEGILSRHFVESIACARALPEGIGTLLDLGSGAGFPGIPIGLCRPEISVTLAESQAKKAAFLREALRIVDLRATVHAQRAETLQPGFDCAVMRAVDRMEGAVKEGSRLVARGGWLGLMTTHGELPGLERAAGPEIEWMATIGVPMSKDRLIALGRRQQDRNVPRGTSL